ncbi:unnamed protein product, partial [Gongylonema pulchrum]|uniref:Uncharacterized protein n=1 Tax=Gongylonema pulchrum TaxID=637853 RepID=A0A183EFE7_9BILA
MLYYSIVCLQTCRAIEANERLVADRHLEIEQNLSPPDDDDDDDEEGSEDDEYQHLQEHRPENAATSSASSPSPPIPSPSLSSTAAGA